VKVSEIGEFKLVDLISKIVNSTRTTDVPWQNLLTGIGDDCAAWKGDTSIQLATVDALVEGIHFNFDFCTWEDLGWKALAINLSDIAAMGGVPRYALVSLGIPGDTDIKNVTAFYRGFTRCAKQFATAVVGGDTDAVPRVSATVTVLGSMGEQVNLLARGNARPGDLIAVTGCPGTAAAGFRMLTRGINMGKTASKQLSQAFLRPLPRIAEGQILVKTGVRSGIDISDGLLSDLRHICKASHTGAVINAENLPINNSVARYFKEDAVSLALSGGEDYELLFTAPPEIMLKAERQLACPVTVIGTITREKGKIFVSYNGKRLEPQVEGWEHFKSK
jgi:thiamine-monophosphate kinase